MKPFLDVFNQAFLFALAISAVMFSVPLLLQMMDGALPGGRDVALALASSMFWFLILLFGRCALLYKDMKTGMALPENQSAGAQSGLNKSKPSKWNWFFSALGICWYCPLCWQSLTAKPHWCKAGAAWCSGWWLLFTAAEEPVICANCVQNK